MAKVKVDFSQGLGQIKQFSSQGVRVAGEELQKQVVREISEGRSPVKRAGGRFQGYSQSYKKAIDKGRYKQFNKRKRPVNLKLSGQLLKSIFVIPKGANRIILGFNNRLADIHNRQGAGRSKVVRRMLPTNEGETFTDNVVLAVGRRLRKVADRIFK